MRTVQCDVCEAHKLPSNKRWGLVTIMYSNPEIGTQKEAKVCWDCQDKSFKKILNKVVVQ